jgi:hypothetical protein
MRKGDIFQVGTSPRSYEVTRITTRTVWGRDRSSGNVVRFSLDHDAINPVEQTGAEPQP